MKLMTSSLCSQGEKPGATDEFTGVVFDLGLLSLRGSTDVQESHYGTQHRVYISNSMLLGSTTKKTLRTCELLTGGPARALINRDFTFPF